ncbi:Adipocyte plasma membrane-associated protein [Halotydeus destructor]|nr:Adipocyte plasma membrane-associated protein [Halotydeus destructor]
MAFVKTVRVILIRSAVVYFFILFAPFLLDFEPVAYKIPLPTFSGALAENNLLSQATKLLENRITGPESIAVLRGSVYTGIADGRIIRLNGKNDFTGIAHISDKICSGHRDMMNCGRPLGMRFDSRDNLYVTDAYFGIKKVNITTGQVETVFSTNKTVIDGRPALFIDDMVFAENEGSNGGHVFYMTDVSAKWTVEFVKFIVMEHEASGRILKYDSDTKEVSALLSNISFPNGIELSDDGHSVLYSELNMRRIMRLYVKGSKAGKTEIFSENLPGEPDNIRRSSSNSETYWVALYQGKDSNSTNQAFMVDYLSEYPTVRKVLMRITYHVGEALMYLGHLLEYPPLIDYGYLTRCARSYQDRLKHRGLAIELDKNGKIIKALHSPDGTVSSLSEVREVVEDGKKVLYLGSYYKSYIGRLVLQ